MPERRRPVNLGWNLHLRCSIGSCSAAFGRLWMNDVATADDCALGAEKIPNPQWPGLPRSAVSHGSQSAPIADA